jgi:hypothetical protein
VKLPDEAIVRISIFQRSLTGDYLIGYTSIDIENRMFNNKYKEIIEN